MHIIKASRQYLLPIHVYYHDQVYPSPHMKTDSSAKIQSCLSDLLEVREDMRSEINIDISCDPNEVGRMSDSLDLFWQRGALF